MKYIQRVIELYKNNPNPDDSELTKIRAECAREDSKSHGDTAATNIYLDVLTSKENI